jgi:hypothetical protein
MAAGQALAKRGGANLPRYPGVVGMFYNPPVGAAMPVIESGGIA